MSAQHLEPKEQTNARRTVSDPLQRSSADQRSQVAQAGYADVQAVLSGDALLPRSQRQALLSSVGRAGGNRRVQRLVASMNQGQSPSVQRDADDVPSDPAQLVNLLGMRCEDGSFGQWFAGHWRTLLGYNPRRVYVGGMGAWTQGATGQTEYTFRPNQRQQSFPSAWYQEMRRLYRTGARVTTSQIAFFWWNQNSLQETVNYWAPLFEPSRRSISGELSTTAMRSPEYRRFLSVMRLSPPEITVPAHMLNAPEYSPR